MRTVVISILVGTPLGLISVGLGHIWMKYVEKENWRGWFMPEMTEQEREDWGL
jgi:hypothetical protein